MTLKTDLLYSSTAEGGVGGADSAQVIYTGIAATSKSIIILGYLEYTLATAGAWVTAPSKIQHFYPGMRLPGDIVQEISTITGAVASGSTVIPYDDTIPQITEGDQYLSQAITPISSANRLIVTSSVNLSHSAAGGSDMTVALFQDATVGSLGSMNQGEESAGRSLLINLYQNIASTATATTLRIRAGAAAAGTTTFNGTGGARRMGGVMSSYLRIQEVMT